MQESQIQKDEKNFNDPFRICKKYFQHKRCVPKGFYWDKKNLNFKMGYEAVDHETKQKQTKTKQNKTCSRMGVSLTDYSNILITLY